MKTRLWRKAVIAFSVISLLLHVGESGADRVKYMYDDGGRLYRVIDESGEVATYNYDAVGNITGIERGTVELLAPQISGISPESFVQGTTSDVVITGANLAASSLMIDNPGVSISGVHTSDSAITAKFDTLPLAPPGPATVVVKNVLGDSQASVTIKATPPRIMLLNPSYGPVTRVVQISGIGFSSDPTQNSVMFGGLAAPVYSSSPSLITTSVPAGATTGPVTVAVANSPPSNDLAFTVSETQGEPPVITSIDPNVGSAEGGNNVKIAGSGFKVGWSVPSVYIGPSTAAISAYSSNEIMLIAPAQKVGKYTVRVNTPDGDAVVPAGFTYIEGPKQTVVSVNPSDNSKNVPVNSTITALFTRPVDPATLNSQSFCVLKQGTGVPVSGVFTFDYGNTSVAFKPSGNLEDNTSYALSITTGVRSDEGVPVDRQVSSIFRTGSIVDVSPPSVTVSPHDGSSGMPVNALIAFGFSKPMNPASINSSTIVVTNNDTPAPGKIALSQNNTVATFTSAGNFLPNSSVRVLLSGKVTDVAGNRIVGSEGVGTDLLSAFTTAAVSDMAPPRILCVDPADQTVGVNSSASVSVTFSEPINIVTVNSNTFGVSVWEDPYAGSIIFSNDNTVATFVPETPFPLSSEISIALGTEITDMAGKGMPLAFKSSFVTQDNADTNRPRMIGVNPYNGQTNTPTNSVVKLAFNEPVHAATVNSATFYVTDVNRQPVSGAITLSPDGKVAVFSPAAPLLPNASYSVYYREIRDVAGNLLDNQGQTEFTTGSSADFSRPDITAVSPANGAKNVLRNTGILVLFSEPIDQTTVNGNTFIVSKDGIPIEGRLEFDQYSSSRLVRYQATDVASLAPNSYYQVTLTTGITDTAGQPLSREFSSGFTTGEETEETEAPIVTGINPFNSQKNVPLNSPIKVAFSKRVHPWTVSDGNFRIIDSETGQPVPGTKSLSADGRLATFKSAQQLIPTHSYYVMVTEGIVDMTGVPLNNPCDSYFTTGIDPDLTAPIVATVPANGALDVPINSRLLVQFNEPVDQTSLNARSIVVSSNGSEVAGNFSLSNDNKVVIYEVAFPGALPPNASCRIAVADTITDTAGNSLAQTSIADFTTGNSEDTSPPVVIGTSPFDGQYDVPTNSIVRIIFDERLLPLWTNSITVSFHNGWYWEQAPGTVSLSADGRVAGFTPAQPLSSNTGYRIQLQPGIRDLAANPIGEQSPITFRTGDGMDLVPPQVVETNPVNTAQAVPTNSRLWVKFNEAIDQSSVNKDTIQISHGGTTVSGTFSFEQDQRTVFFQVSEPDLFLPNTLYDLKVTTEVRDSVGNPLSQEFTTCFTTGEEPDFEQPRIVASSPYNGQTDVPTNSVIHVVFSEPMDPLTLNNMNCYMGDNFQFGFSVSPDGRSITLTPPVELDPNYGYWFFVSENIRDKAGNALINPGVINFTTGAGPDSTPPVVLATSPADGAMDVPVNAVVTVRFSEVVDETTINEATIIVSRDGEPIEGNFSFDHDSDSKYVRFRPADPRTFLPHASYQLRVTTGVTNTGGKPLAIEHVSTFTTGNLEDLDAPQIISVSPADGAIDVSPFTSISVTFTEPINPITLNNATFRLIFENLPPLSYDSDPEAFIFPGAFTLSPDGKTVTFTPAYPILAGQSYRLQLVRIEDLAANQLSERIYGFKTALAPGTDPQALPDFTEVYSSSEQLKPDGLSTSEISCIIMDVNGSQVPDGTRVAVTSSLVYGVDSGGGTILGGVESAACPGFRLFTVADGMIHLNYQSPHLPDLGWGFVRAYVQVFSVDAQDNLVNRIGRTAIALRWETPE